jgi:hypothetical protein
MALNDLKLYRTKIILPLITRFSTPSVSIADNLLLLQNFYDNYFIINKQFSNQ